MGGRKKRVTRADAPFDLSYIEMVDVVATRKGVSADVVEDGMTMEQIELAYHFARREQHRSFQLHQIAVRTAIIEAFSG